MKALLLVADLEDYTVSYVNGLVRHMPVVLGVPRRRYAGFTSYFDPAVDLRLLEWPRHRALSNPWFLFNLTRLIRRERPSLIHLLSNTTIWLNFAAPFWRPIPLVTTVHDLELHPGDVETSVMPTWSSNLIVRQSGHVVVHGERLRKMALERFAKAPDRVHVLSHPAIVHYSALARREKLVRRPEDGTVRAMMFGRIFAYKGLEQLIRAEALLKDTLPNLRVTIAGRGDDPWGSRQLMGRTERYDIRRGYIPDVEVAQLFLDSDFIVLPYIEASQSGVLNLAAAFGKPVIVTDVGELRACVEPNGLGLVVPPGDPERLARAMQILTESSTLRNELGANALAWATGPNSPESVGASAASLYRSVVRSCA